jgi:hypothetical protein
VLVPLAFYLGITVVAPALRGAVHEPGFWRHAAITAGAAAVVTAMWWVAARLLVRTRL